MQRTAWVGAVLIGLVQVVVPVVFVVWALVHAFVGALQTPSPEVRGAARVGEHVVYAVPQRDEGDASVVPTQRRAIVRVGLDDDDAPEPIAELDGDGDEPVLLTVGDRLLAFEDSAVTIVEGASVRRIELAERLPSVLWPVVVDRAPAVVALGRDFDADAHVLALHVLEGDRLVVRRSVPTMLGFDPRRLRVVSTGDALHVLVDGYDAPVHHAVWTADGGVSWTRTPVELDEWTAVAFAGTPAVLGLDESNETPAVVGWRRSTGWREFMIEPRPSAYRIGAVELDDDRIAVITDTMLDGVAVLEIAPDGIVQEHEHSASTVMDETIALIAASQIVPLLLTGLFALVVSRRLRIHHVGEHVVGHRVARYATLARRAVAKAIDAALSASVPLLYLAVRGVSEIDESSFVGVCLLWVVPVGVGLTVLEGVTGRTPGKRLLGIRVVGLDLRTPVRAARTTAGGQRW